MADHTQIDQIKKHYYLAWIICTVTACFYCYEYILRITPSVMTREIMGEYHLNARTFGNLSASYYYIYAPMQLFVGVLLDRFGPRFILTLAILACGLGAYAFAATHLLYVAEIGRLFIGLGSAFAFVGMLKVAAIWLPSRRYGFISGVAASLGVIGGVMGDVVLSRVLVAEGWKLTCYIIAGFGVGLSLLLFWLLKNQNCTSRTESGVSIRELFAEIHSLLKNQQFWLNGILGCLLYLPVAGFAESWQIPFMTQALNYTQYDAANAASLFFMGFGLGAPLFGWLSDTLRLRAMLLSIGTALGLIFLASCIYVPNIQPVIIGALSFITGLFCSVQPLCFAIARENSSQRLTATAIALTNTMVMAAGASVWLIGDVLESDWHGRLIGHQHIYMLGTFQWALLILPIGLLVAVFLSFFLRETHGKLVNE